MGVYTMKVTKRNVFNIIIISILSMIILILIITIADKNKHIDTLRENAYNNSQCNLLYAEMSNYVMNNYDNIADCCNELLLRYSEITYTDDWGGTAIKKESYDELMTKYHLNHFTGDETAHISQISENSLNFIYCQKKFTNGYYASFEFVFEDGCLTVVPYRYEPIDKTE